MVPAKHQVVQANQVQPSCQTGCHVVATRLAHQTSCDVSICHTDSYSRTVHEPMVLVLVLDQTAPPSARHCPAHEAADQTATGFPGVAPVDRAHRDQFAVAGSAALALQTLRQFGMAGSAALALPVPAAAITPSP